MDAVFEAALELTQSGFKLLSAPLPPNVPLIRAPYRSLILVENSRQYDAEGIKALEKAKERLAVLGASPLNDRQAQDAAFIDKDLLLKSLGESGGSF